MLSRRQLLTVCQTVLLTRPQLVEKARETLRNNKPELIPEIEALLAKPRSTQMLMDLTLGADYVVTDANIEIIFERMRETVGEEIKKKKELEIKKIKSEAKKTFSDLSSKVVTAENRVDSWEAAYDQTYEIEKKMVNGWVRSGQALYEKGIRVQKIIFSVVWVMLGIGTFYLSSLAINTTLAIIFGLVVAIIPTALAIAQLFDRYPNILKPLLEKKREGLFRERALEANREDLLRRATVNWENQTTSLVPPARPYPAGDLINK